MSAEAVVLQVEGYAWLDVTKTRRFDTFVPCVERTVLLSPHVFSCCEMATLSCRCASTRSSSLIYLQRQEQYICHVECTSVNSGSENPMREALEASFLVGSGPPFGKTSSVILSRHGVDDIEVVPTGTNVEKRLNRNFLSKILIEKRRLPSQYPSFTSPESGQSEDGTVLSIAAPAFKSDVELNIKVHNIREGGPWNSKRNGEFKNVERELLRTGEMSSVTFVDYMNAMDFKEGGIDRNPGSPKLDHRPSSHVEIIHPNTTADGSCKPQPQILQSFFRALSPLRRLKGWIENSLRRVFPSMKIISTFTRDSKAAQRSNEGLDLNESSSDPPVTADLTMASTSIEAENGFPWEFLKSFLDNPAFVRLRLSISLANSTMTLSTFLCRALPILSDLKTKVFWKGISVSLSLRPFGSGIVLDPAVSNLAVAMTRLLVHLAIVWVLWTLKRITRAIIGALQKHGAVERRVFNILVLTVEALFGATVFFTVLSSLACSSPSLAAPVFIALALVGKDFFWNYFAGFFLLAAQPIQPGHTVSIPCYYKDRKPIAAISWMDGDYRSGWFEGVCESVGLTYTVLRDARCRFRIPNSIFMKREFLVVDSSHVSFNEHGSTKPLESVKIF